VDVAKQEVRFGDRVISAKVPDGHPDSCGKREVAHSSGW
jgi:hypothetical protein